MFFENNKTLEFNQYQKSDKALFIIYADLECLMERIYCVKIILKIHPRQKSNMLRQVFQRLQYFDLKT